MTELSDLRAELVTLKAKLDRLEKAILPNVKKIIDLHTHLMDGSVHWNINSDIVKAAIEQAAAKNIKQSPFKENVTAQDNFKYDLQKVKDEF